MMMQKKVERYFYLKSVQKGNFSGKREDFSIWTKRACGHKNMGTGSHQVRVATLNLFQPGGRLCPPYTEQGRNRRGDRCDLGRT